MAVQKVLWLADSVIEQTHPDKWAEALSLANELVTVIGKNDRSHTVIDPVIALRNLAYELEGQQYSTIFDLSGWLGEGLQPLFPNTEVYTGFSTSRIKDIAGQNPNIADYEIRVPPEEIIAQRERLDLSKPLIIDDAGFGGGTSEFIMKLWGIRPETATHAFLVANTGDITSSDGRSARPGVVKSLEGLGSKVVYGESLVSPQEDAWHLRDLYEHHDIRFELTDALSLRDSVVAESGRIIDQPRLNDFPGLNVVGWYTGKDGSLLTRGPIIWAQRGFEEAVDLNTVRNREPEVSHLLSRLSSVSSEPRGIRPIITKTLRADIQNIGGIKEFAARSPRREKI